MIKNFIARRYRMNNRQKAKHWKQLYEMSLPKNLILLFISTLHCNICDMFNQYANWS